MKGTGSSSGVAGDVVLLLGSSVVDKVLGVVFFFLFPFVDVHRTDKPCTIVLQVVTSSGLRFFFFQSHPGRLPISWLVPLLSIESFVGVMSPGFHSTAFLVHLSGFGVAIRRACRISVSSVFQTNL